MKILNDIIVIDKATQMWRKIYIIEWINNYWIENILLDKYVIITLTSSYWIQKLSPGGVLLKRCS